MAEITTQDLLTVQRNITDANRADNAELRQHVTTQITAVHHEVRELRNAQSNQQVELGALRTLVEERTQPGSAFELSKKQKAAIASAGIAILGACADGARHLVVWFVAYLKSGAVVR